MKKTIPDVVNFPNGCETVRFTACFVSMLMRAEGITDNDCDFFCEKPGDNKCVRCGQCKDLVPLHRKHEELYNLYTAVTGFGFLQMDLSNDDHMRNDWNQTCNEMLREFDWYIGFTMEYAGYDYEEIIFGLDEKKRVFEKIKASIDQNIPVPALFGERYQWVLITGYDDGGALYGYDGSQGYWGKPYAEPAGYDVNGLFIMPDWYEKKGHAFILGAKKAPTVTIQDVFKRGINIMENMQRKGYYQNSVNFMTNDANFDHLSDDALLVMRDRISAWIGQPIDQRAMLGYAMNPLRIGKTPDREIVAFNAAHSLCWTSHDVLWIVWRAIGEYMGGDKLDWAKGLKNKTIRRMIADCFKMVCDHDEYMLGELKKGFNGKPGRLTDRDVRIVYLPPSAVASAHHIGEGCEGVVYGQICKFINENNLHDRKPDFRAFGFNNPMAGLEGTPSAGYEAWVTIPDTMEVCAPLIKKQFSGGLYAAHMIPMGAFDEWGWLRQWVMSNDRYEHAWGEIRVTPYDKEMDWAMEEPLNFYNTAREWGSGADTQQLDLLFPIKPKFSAV